MSAKLKTYYNAFIVIICINELLFIFGLYFFHVGQILYCFSVVILCVCKDIYEHTFLIQRESKMHNSVITLPPILLSLIHFYIYTSKHRLDSMIHNRLAVCYTRLFLYSKKHHTIKRVGHLVSIFTYITYYILLQIHIIYYILLNYAIIYQNIYYIGYVTIEKIFIKTKNA